MAECLQSIYGPTPCFRESGAEFSEKLPCGLSKCPVAEYLSAHPEAKPWAVLHSQCVITDPFDYKGADKSIQLALISRNKKD